MIKAQAKFFKSGKVDVDVQIDGETKAIVYETVCIIKDVIATAKPKGRFAWWRIAVYMMLSARQLHKEGIVR